MSDASQGEGWWQASDGRWYPPEQHPGTPAPPPQAPQPSVADASPTAGAPSSTLPPPHPGSAPPVPGTVPPPTTDEPAPAAAAHRWLLLAAVIVTVLGALLPWAQVSSFFGTISKAGTEGDGIITLGLALVIGGLALPVILSGRSVGKGRTIAALVLAVLIGLIAVIDIADVQSAIDDVGDTGLVEASVGIGLWLTALGAGLGIAGAVAGLRSR